MMYPVSMVETSKDHGDRWVVGLVWLVSLAAVVWVFAPAVGAYFFLFDDFKIVGQALELSPAALVTQPHFHYFRPLVHIAMWFEAMAFGWTSPWGYAGVGLMLHVLNAGLYAGLLRRAQVRLGVAALASGLFFMAPWALETLFWASCRFELMACSAVLLACHVGYGLRSADQGRWGRARFVGLVLASCLCKETSVALWLGMLVALRLAPARWQQTIPPSLSRGVASALLAYMVTRAVVMLTFTSGDPLGGHRGNVLALLLSEGAAWNLVAHLQTIATPPLASGQEALGLLHVGVLGLGLVGALRGSLRTTSLALLVAFATLLPALWIPREAASLAGGRLLYMPTLFVTFTVATGWSRVGRWLGWHRSVVAVLLLASAGVSLSSGRHQAELWRAAYTVSRTAIAAYETHGEPSGPRHVTNMPFVMREGPYLLKAYAFEWFNGRGAGHPVSATPVVYEMRSGELRTVPRWGDAHGRPPGDAEPITLQLEPLSAFR
jgi:hypothetical protein